VLAAEGDQLLLAWPPPAGLELDEGARRLAPLLVGPRDHRRLQHRRVLVERVLDLDRRDVLAARDDDVLGAVLELDVAVGVHTPRSPVWNQPPRRPRRVAFGFFR
jgi:hypothetical protein